MERLKQEQSTGLTSARLHSFGILFVALGVFSRSVLQNQMLGMQSGTGALLDAMMNRPEGMIVATVALILQMAETCAVPIFCFLLVEGAMHTGDIKQYILRMLILALVSEIPYNIAMGGKLLDLGSRNPVFALVLCLVLFHYYGRYSEKKFSNSMIKVLATFAAAIWTIMLGIDQGICIVLIASVLWGFRNKPNFRVIMGCSATILCTLFSLYYLVAPMSLMFVHFYNGDRGERNRKIDYWYYPLILTGIGVASMFMF